MAESDDFRTLENISTEVDNYQEKSLISSYCIKAQDFLIDKLKKEAERQTQICKFIGSNNLKLETEIKFAENEIKSLNTAIETINLGNIELNTEYLLSKKRTADIFERTKIGKKKYENLWSLSKEKYENIPIVQTLTLVKNKNQKLHAIINDLIGESKNLLNKMKIKQKDFERKDREHIIKLAEFFVHERTNIFIKINENDMKIKEILNEVDILSKENSENNCNIPHNKPLQKITKMLPKEENIRCDISNNTEKIDTLLFPKLILQNKDLDILSVKLEPIKNVDLQNKTSLKRSTSPISQSLKENHYKKYKKEENNDDNYISSYFNIATFDDRKLVNKYHADKKIIHVLEDIKLDENDTYKIINKLEFTNFHSTKYITSKATPQYEKISNSQDEKNKSLEIEEINIDSAKEREEVAIDPPSQFLDNSQRSPQNKSKSPISQDLIDEDHEISLQENTIESKGTDATKSQEKTLNNSITSDESHTTVKERILKKRNLDLSPQIVYSKSNLLHKQHEEKTTSKFFESKDGQDIDMNKDDYNKTITQEQILNSEKSISKTCEIQNIHTADGNYPVISSPKEENKNLQLPRAGFLFNHGPEGIPDSLNVSISTTGFEDNDFPHYVDSSVLLSPTPDVPATIESSNNNEVLSQGMPSFLAGFRKAGISFFGSTTSSDTKTDAGALHQSSGFNFAFGNEEKKGRSGFFSMFH